MRPGLGMSGACVLGLGLAVLALDGGAATLAEVKAGRSLHLCANPEALPFTSQEPALPGIQLEIAQLIADGLGAKTQVSWVFSPRGIRLAGCEVSMGAMASADAKGPMRLTKPYFGTGYVLVVPRATNGVTGFEDLKGQKIGVLVQSVAQWVLSKRGLTTTPSLAQEDIIDQVVAGQAAGGALPAAFAAWYLREHPAASLKAIEVYAEEPELRWNVAVGIRNTDQALVDAVSVILEGLQRAGTLQSTFAKYGVPYHQPFPTE
jgi:polar amino acid transport system substrate-binding protein